MAEAPNFAKLVPGFEFLQGLMKNAGSAMPNIGQWVAPTLNPEEIEKRIQELRTVKFWLEQNARMLEATIQALEVQRMTLSTLKTMNVQMEDLRDSLQIRLPTLPSADPAKAAPAAAEKLGGKSGPGGDAAARQDTEAESPAGVAGGGSEGGSGSAAAPARIDPLQWWGALTKQFTQLATSAMNETAAGAAQTLAGNVMKQAFDQATSAGAAGERGRDGGSAAGKTGARPAAKRGSTPRKRSASAKRAG